MRVRSGVIGMVAVALPFSTSVKVRSNACTQGAKFSSRKAWASCGVILMSGVVRDISQLTFRVAISFKEAKQSLRQPFSKYHLKKKYLFF